MAAAGLWTTPSELIRYATTIQKILKGKDGGVLRQETVRTMLTPGMNEWGLGPVVSEHTFGHGGADEGFRAQLVAWKDQPYAAVVMVNSDNGSILRELLLAIANEYDLPGIEPTVREISELPVEQLERYVASYLFDDESTCEIEVVESQLIMSAEWLDTPMKLLPESATYFFDVSNGMRVEFHLDGDVISGLTLGDSLAERLP
jgi:hypothetical protein